MAVDYATVVAGIVTAITTGAGSLPASNTTTLYIDITPWDTVSPDVGWYFNETCLTFSATAPVIPPGSVAPPYPPGGTPVPPGGGTGTTPGPSAPSILVPVLIPFHADTTTGMTITDIPLATTEIDTLSRTAFDLSRAYYARLQAQVDVAGNTFALAAVQFSSDNGSTWEYLDGINGPWLRIDAIGDKRSSQFSIDALARDDILLRAVSCQGDGATDPILGNFGLLVWICIDPIPTFPTPVLVSWPGACSSPGGIEHTDDFGGYGGTIAGFVAAWVGSTLLTFGWDGEPTDSAVTYLDAGYTFNGSHALAGVYSNGAGTYDQTAIGFIADFVTHKTDLTTFMLFALDTSMDTDGSGGAPPHDGTGFEIWSMYFDGTPVNAFAILLRNGRVYLDAYIASAYGTAVDLGDLTVWTGKKLQLIVKVERISTTDYEVSIYLDDPCPGSPTLLSQTTHTGFSSGEQIAGWGVFHQWANSFTTAGTVRMWQAAYDTDSTTYGV